MTKYQVNWDNGSCACGTFSIVFDTYKDADAFGNEWADESNIRDFGSSDPDEDCYTFDVIEVDQSDGEPVEIDDGGRRGGLNMGRP